jgi:hypothetical protein
MNARDVAGEVRQLRQLVQAIGDRCDLLITHIETKGLDIDLPDDDLRAWMLTVEQLRELFDVAVAEGLARGYERVVLQ